VNENELARAVAADLGPDVLASVETPSLDDRTRAFSTTEATAIAGFLLQCAQVILEIWRARKDRLLLVEALANSEKLMQAYPRLDAERRLGLIARLLNKFLPDTFGRSPHDHSAAANKRQWVASYSVNRGATADPNERSFHGGRPSCSRSRTNIGGSSITTSGGCRTHLMELASCAWMCPGAS
jgi:hypothetical protein